MTDKWNNIYSQKNCGDDSPGAVLVENTHLLPDAGNALDLACGMGANAIHLAKLNFQVDAWDISSGAVNKLNQYAQSNNLNINACLRDVEKMPPAIHCYDVITVTYFLHRPTLHTLRESLRVNGLLFYQTFTVDKVTQGGPTNPEFLLVKNELLELCRGMEILVYREEGLQGDVSKGWRNQAMIVAKQVN